VPMVTLVSIALGLAPPQRHLQVSQRDWVSCDRSLDDEERRPGGLLAAGVLVAAVAVPVRWGVRGSAAAVAGRGEYEKALRRLGHLPGIGI
jgi:hypothetical protein